MNSRAGLDDWLNLPWVGLFCLVVGQNIMGKNQERVDGSADQAQEQQKPRHGWSLVPAPPPYLGLNLEKPPSSPRTGLPLFRANRGREAMKSPHDPMYLGSVGGAAMEGVHREGAVLGATPDKLESSLLIVPIRFHYG
jgi:hypothetical protein